MKLEAAKHGFDCKLISASIDNNRMAIPLLRKQVKIKHKSNYLVNMDYVLGVLGIVVSLILFLIGHRQTIGDQR